MKNFFGNKNVKSCQLVIDFLWQSNDFEKDLKKNDDFLRQSYNRRDKSTLVFLKENN